MRIALPALLAFLLCVTVSAAQFTGTCIRVSDGDTVTVQEADDTKFKVRLAAIDAPEKDQPFGQEAKARLTELLLDKAVVVQFKAVDRYGRILGTVLIGDVDAASVMLRDGLAWHYSYFDKDADNAALAEEAKAAKRGLWSQPNPTPPWEYRQAIKSSQK